MLQSGMFFPTVLRGESAMRPKSPGSLLSIQGFAAQGWLRQAPESDLIYR